MAISFVIFVATIVMTKADTSKIDFAKADREFLQGTWVPVAMAENSKVMTMDQYTREVTDDRLQRITFSGDTCFVETHEPDETIRIEKSRFTLDPTHRPKRIDIFRGDEIYHAIYSMSPHELRICVRSGGGPPPAAFQTKGEPDVGLCILKRQKAHESRH